jgi:hypothetical protein
MNFGQAIGIIHCSVREAAHQFAGVACPHLQVARQFVVHTDPCFRDKCGGYCDSNRRLGRFWRCELVRCVHDST